MSNALVIKDHPDKPERISKRLKSALDAMVWPDETGKSLDWFVAAQAANISRSSMKRSLERPVVRMYLRQQREVFRAALSSKTLSRLAELGWQDENRNAAVAAIRVIDGQEEQSRAPNVESPRLTIKIINQTAPEPAGTIEHEPQPELTDDPHDATRQLREPYFRDPTDPFR
jgi:hypothetical protein